MHRLRGFTLVELLVVVSIIGVLAAFAVPAIQQALNRSRQAASLSNLRQIGMALLNYAADHEMRLPPRATGTDPATGLPAEKWPRRLSAYIPDVNAFVDPSDPRPASTNPNTFFANNRNNSSYIYNGFNDLGAFTDPALEVRLTAIPQPSRTILFSKQRHGAGNFYMDVLEGAGNHIDVLDWKTYGRRLHYFFADGSARWLTQAEYDPALWLVDKSFELP